jgi:VanZ family protein
MSYPDTMNWRALRRWVLWGPVVLYALLIFHFSSESNPLPGLTSLVWDKALHTTEYAGLALLICRALRGEGLRWWRSVTLAVILASVYAATDEWHQFFVPQRDADVADWAADLIGAAAGSSLYRLISEVIKLEAGGWGAGG